MERMDTSEDDDFQTKSQAFLSWLQQNGATISPKIELADLRDRNAGRGVVAKEDLPEDEELFSIPRTSILTLETSTLPTETQQSILAATNDPWLSLIVTMVLEYLKSSESLWKPYFDILPENFDTLMFWSEAELDFLQGSAVVEKIGKETADTTFQETLIPTIGRVAASLQIPQQKSSADLLQLCHRMGSTIMAYAFDLEKNSPEQDDREGEEDWEEEDSEGLLPKGMIPLADMLNANADLNNAKLFYENDRVVMKTIAPVRAGEELYNDFGALPRTDLLRRYGYVTDHYAKYDVVEVPADLIKSKAHDLPTLKNLDERWSYLEEQGILDDGYDVARAESEEGQFPEELCVLLNLLVTPQVEFEKLKKKDKLPKPDLTSDAKKLLRTVLVHRYAQYRSDSDQPPSDATINEHRRKMAADVIEGEKQVLREAVAAITDAPADKKKRAADTLDDEAAAIRNPTKR